MTIDRWPCIHQRDVVATFDTLGSIILVVKDETDSIFVADAQAPR